jgi:hypothetical protein
MWPGKSIKIMLFSVLTFFENFIEIEIGIEIQIAPDINHE